MKKIKWLSLFLAIIGMSFVDVPRVEAQTSTNVSPASFTDLMQDMWTDVEDATNWTVGGGYGHSVGGVGRNIVGGGIAYNFLNNAGLYLGEDTLFSSHHHQNNAVKGGITLNATITPFGFIGSTFLTNIVATPYAGILLASGIGNSAIGEITVAGSQFNVVSWKNFITGPNVWYQNRQGEGYWDGNYFGAFWTVTRKF